MERGRASNVLHDVRPLSMHVTRAVAYGSLAALSQNDVCIRVASQIRQTSTALLCSLCRKNLASVVDVCPVASGLRRNYKRRVHRGRFPEREKLHDNASATASGGSSVPFRAEDRLSDRSFAPHRTSMIHVHSVQRLERLPELPHRQRSVRRITLPLFLGLWVTSPGPVFLWNSMPRMDVLPQ